MKNSNPLFLLLLLVLLLSVTACKSHKIALELFDTNGTSAKPIDAIETGDSLSLGLRGLAPRAGVQIYLNDDTGKEWSYARLFADKAGNIPPGLFWYQTGVIGTTSRKVNFKPDPSFVTFEEAEEFFGRHPLKLTVRDLQKNVLAERNLPFRKRSKPIVYPSNQGSLLVNAFNVTNEDIYASGRNFPAGSTVHLFAVTNQYVWNEGDKLTDMFASASVNGRLNTGRRSF